MSHWGEHRQGIGAKNLRLIAGNRTGGGFIALGNNCRSWNELAEHCGLAVWLENYTENPLSRGSTGAHRPQAEGRHALVGYHAGADISWRGPPGPGGALVCRPGCLLKPLTMRAHAAAVDALGIE